VASPADWSQGDWNFDGQFGSGDLVAAFADGGYELGAAPARPAQLIPPKVHEERNRFQVDRGFVHRRLDEVDAAFAIHWDEWFAADDDEKDSKRSKSAFVP
jgi:hypothetical protein